MRLGSFSLNSFIGQSLKMAVDVLCSLMFLQEGTWDEVSIISHLFYDAVLFLL